jgi:hypothetical protein
MYSAVVFLHIAGVFAFLIAHGASANVAWQLRRMSNAPVNVEARERLCALLELSQSSAGLLYGALFLILLSGIAGGFMGHWWGRGWIWTALGVLVLTVILMFARGVTYFEQLRMAIGLPGRGTRTPPPPKSPDEVAALLKSPRPLEVSAIGSLGLLVLLGLMVFKPF